MNYDKQKFEAGLNIEIQRAEIVANKFSDIAEKTSPYMESKKREMFENVGTETRSRNYDKAQRILEGGAQWDDNLRGAASEINQIDQEKRGTKPLSFEGAQAAMSGYARDCEKMSKEPRGRQQYLELAMGIDNIVADASEPGTEGIDNALEYIEGTMKSKANVADSILKSKGPLGEQAPEFLKDWQEKRAIRDALYQEKQKRIEQLKQSQQATEEVTKGRGLASRNLENLYAQAGVPEDTPSRQEFFAKVQHMSSEELYFLDAALKKTAVEFGRTRNPKMLDGRLMDLVSKSFKLEDVAKRQKEEDERKIEEIRRKMGLPGTTEQQPMKPSGRTEEEIEKSKRRIEELMPSKGPQKRERTVESQSLDKEVPKQEKETPNPFEKLFGSKEVTDALDSPDENAYTQEKGVAAMTEVFKKLYPDAKRFATRIETLLHDSHSAQAEAQRTEPNADEFTRNVIAHKLLVGKLPQSERQAIEKFLVQNAQRVGGGKPGEVSRMSFTPEFVLPDFIRFLERLKK